MWKWSREETSKIRSVSNKPANLGHVYGCVVSKPTGWVLPLKTVDSQWLLEMTCLQSRSRIQGQTPWWCSLCLRLTTDGQCGGQDCISTQDFNPFALLIKSCDFPSYQKARDYKVGWDQSGRWLHCALPKEMGTSALRENTVTSILPSRFPLRFLEESAQSMKWKLTEKDGAKVKT